MLNFSFLKKTQSKNIVNWNKPIKFVNSSLNESKFKCTPVYFINGKTQVSILREGGHFRFCEKYDKYGYPESGLNLSFKFGEFLPPGFISLFYSYLLGRKFWRITN